MDNNSDVSSSSIDESRSSLPPKEEEVSLLSKIAAIGEPNPDETLHVLDVKPSSWRDIIGFWICGLLNNFGYVVMLSAAEDMLPPNLSPAYVLLSDILPCFIVQLTAPYFMNRIPYSIRIIFTVSMAIASFLLPAFFSHVALKLLGVVCASISSGFGEITFLAYSAHYHKNTVSAWSSGTGGAGILGSFSYLGLRYVLSAKNTLLVSSPLPLGIALCYFFVVSKPAEIKEPAVSDTKKPSLPVRQQFRLLFRLLPFMIPLGLVYFGEYLINQGITPVLTFEDNKYFANGKAYKYYQAIYQVGVFISRSSVNFLPIKSIFLLQLPALFQIINAIFLSFVGIYNFIPSIYVVFAVIFWEGLLGGSIYVNTFYLMSQKFEGAEKEFCLGATSQAYGLSISIAAVVGIFYTPFLKKHRRFTEKGGWETIESQKQLFEFLATKFRIKNLDGWYKISSRDVINNGGGGVLAKYEFKLERALISIFPEYHWQIWKFNLPKSSWKQSENQKLFFEQLYKHLKLSSWEDWVRVTNKQVMDNGGENFLKLYNNSHLKALKQLFPEKAFQLSEKKFEVSNSEEKMKYKDFFLDMCRKLNLKFPEDILNNKLSLEDIKSNGGEFLLTKTGNSIVQLLESLFPDKDWWSLKTEIYFNNKEKWKEAEHQRKFFEELGKKLGIIELDNWYSVKHSEIVKHGGGNIVRLYNHSHIKALGILYPSHTWKIQIPQVPKVYWKEERNQIDFLQFMANKLNIKKMEDWYDISGQDFFHFGGQSLVHQFGIVIGTSLIIIKDGGHIELIMSKFPSYDWKLWKFTQVPKNFWTLEKNQKLLFNHIWKDLGLKDFSNWYQVRYSDVSERGAGPVLNKFYNGSLQLALPAIYPEYKWEFQSKNKHEKGYWKNVDNQKKFFEELYQKLSLKSWEDWHLVSTMDIVDNGGLSILKIYEYSLMKALTSLFPDYPWNMSKHSLLKKTGIPTPFSSRNQNFLFSELQEIFSGYDLYTNFVIGEEEENLNSKQRTEVDIAIPSLLLAFEYQGEQHYKKLSEGVFKPLEQRVKKDEAKREKLKQASFRLIEVPYWWNGTRESLFELIKQAAPDVLDKIKSS